MIAVLIIILILSVFYSIDKNRMKEPFCNSYSNVKESNKTLANKYNTGVDRKVFRGGMTDKEYFNLNTDTGCDQAEFKILNIAPKEDDSIVMESDKYIRTPYRNFDDTMSIGQKKCV
jgi:hypothetical protein